MHCSGSIGSSWVACPRIRPSEQVLGLSPQASPSRMDGLTCGIPLACSMSAPAENLTGRFEERPVSPSIHAEVASHTIGAWCAKQLTFHQWPSWRPHYRGLDSTREVPKPVALVEDRAQKYGVHF
jgi:hypothetical protein